QDRSYTSWSGNRLGRPPGNGTTHASWLSAITAKREPSGENGRIARPVLPGNGGVSAMGFGSDPGGELVASRKPPSFVACASTSVLPSGESAAEAPTPASTRC